MKTMKIINDKRIQGMEQEHLLNSFEITELVGDDTKIINNDNKKRKLLNNQDQDQDQVLSENHHNGCNNDNNSNIAKEEIEEEKAKEIDSLVQEITHEFLTPIYHPEKIKQKKYSKKRSRSINSYSSVISNTTSTIDNINSVNITTTITTENNNMCSNSYNKSINSNAKKKTNHLSSISSFLTNDNFWNTLQFMNDESNQNGYNGDEYEAEADDSDGDNDEE